MMPRPRPFALALALLVAPALGAQPALDAGDRARLAEAFALARNVGDSVWNGWSRTHFAVLLVTPTHEFLVGHPRPSSDFAHVGHDSLLASDVLVRARRFPIGMLATFPAVNGVPTVVVGQPAHTGKRSTEWVLTLLHEHLHQLQTTQRGYYDGVRGLRLASGDTTGMWMLEYPFPYADARARQAFDAVAHAAADADTSAFRRAWHRLRAAVREDDARYLAFQLWQEGVARYTEHAVAALAARRHTPTEAYAALADVESYADAAAASHRRILAEARVANLGTSRREVVYPVGAAIALMLDAAKTDWRSAYFDRPFGFDVLR